MLITSVLCIPPDREARIVKGKKSLKQPQNRSYIYVVERTTARPLSFPFRRSQVSSSQKCLELNGQNATFEQSHLCLEPFGFEYPCSFECLQIKDS